MTDDPISCDAVLDILIAANGTRQKTIAALRGEGQP